MPSSKLFGFEFEKETGEGKSIKQMDKSNVFRKDVQSWKVVHEHLSTLD
ncbi:nuclear transport factor 2 family protein [Alkalihalobacillus sp. TS-13]|nr:nuclear transport factor 2 family protein [Alkalihalobacillus sp. TS-13]